MAKYLKMWESAKKKFEEATGKKKPSDMFTKKIRKGSGIEKALKEIDSLVASNKWDKVTSAFKTFTKAETAYIEVAKAATKKEAGGYKAYSGEINGLVNDLRKIGFAINKELGEKESLFQVSVEDVIGKTNFKAITKGVALDSAVKAFATKDQLFLNAATAQKDPALEQLSKKASASFKTYSTTIAEIKKTGGYTYKSRVYVVKFLAQKVGDLLESVGHGGLLGVLVEWKRYQSEAMAKADRSFANTAMDKIGVKASKPLNAEFNNLTKVEQFLDNMR